MTAKNPCPIKLISHSGFYECDSNCPLWYDECTADGRIVGSAANGCAFTAIPEYLNEMRDALQRLPEKLGDIEDAILASD